MNNSLMFSHKNDAWATPQDFFDDLDKKYNFVWDLAASDDNHLTANYYTESDNALVQNWSKISGWLWCNPPYSMCKEFVKKAYDEMLLGAKIIMLVPARTDTRWFHDYVYQKIGVGYVFIKGRLTFGSDDYWRWIWEQEEIDGKPNKLYLKYGKKNPAPFPSMIIIFDKNTF